MQNLLPPRFRPQSPAPAHLVNMLDLLEYFEIAYYFLRLDDETVYLNLNDALGTPGHRFHNLVLTFEREVLCHRRYRVKVTFSNGYQGTVDAVVLSNLSHHRSVVLKLERPGTQSFSLFYLETPPAE